MKNARAHMVSFSLVIDSLFNLSEKNLFTEMLAHQSSSTMIVFLYEGKDNDVITLILQVFL
jgi:hypothetical protein